MRVVSFAALACLAEVALAGVAPSSYKVQTTTKKTTTSARTSQEVTTTVHTTTTVTLTSTIPNQPSTLATVTTPSLPSGTPVKNSGKRGLSYNDPTLTQPFSLSGQNSKISWSYNWASEPYFGTQPSVQNHYNPALTYIPMLWSNAPDLTGPWPNNLIGSKYWFNADALLTFNEPDGCYPGMACMNVTSAIATWKASIQPFASAVKLGAPAVTNGGAPMGLTWLSQFISQCGAGCTIDFIPLHWYGDVSNPANFINYVAGAYAQFKKPIWVTEFGSLTATEAQMVAFLKVVLPWLDQQSYVQRYAYFMDNAGGTGLIDASGVGLSTIGKLYNSL